MASDSSYSQPSTSRSLDEWESDVITSPRKNTKPRKRKRAEDDCCGIYSEISDVQYKSVSDWKICKLDRICLSYKRQSSIFDDFFRLVGKFGFEPLADEMREVLNSLTRLTKNTSFNVRRIENKAYCVGELEKCVEVTREIRTVWNKLMTERRLSW
jgi:hypothetical protein